MSILALCLAAAFATAGVLATGAFAAEPAWFACVKASPKNSGNYNNKTCTEASEPGKGKYELKEGVGKAKAFKGSGGAAVLHVKTWLGDEKVECASSKDAGKPAAPNLETDVTVAYSKCTVFTTHECTSAGAKAGEIKVPAMKGKLGYVEEGATPVVGLRLENEASPGGTLAEFNCGIVRATLNNQVIGVVSKDVNVVNTQSELNDEATERYGEHEFDGKKFKPLVNILGWANEVAGIEAAQKENDEEADPAHVLKGEFCGELVEELLGVECTPPAYAGLDATIVNKGEALMIKA
ncbi:MAG TPA: hypothetical protein VED41_13540 [Solirubrobacteraceae bacterium]|nr:hypothetical protein [Solirubrobacteraceae bacterium]